MYHFQSNYYMLLPWGHSGAMHTWVLGVIIRQCPIVAIGACLDYQIRGMNSSSHSFFRSEGNLWRISNTWVFNIHYILLCVREAILCSFIDLEVCVSCPCQHRFVLSRRVALRCLEHRNLYCIQCDIDFHWCTMSSSCNVNHTWSWIFCVICDTYTQLINFILHHVWGYDICEEVYSTAINAQHKS